MTLGDLTARVYQRLNEVSSAAGYYSPAEVTAAINEGQRFFCLLTLCLEATANFTLAANTSFYHMLTTFPDWLVPLRVYCGVDDVRPSSLSLLSAYAPNWMAVTGSPERYVAKGLDFFAIYPTPTSATALSITYARAPQTLTNGSDAPEIPEAYHSALADYGVYRLRIKEGGQESAKVMAYWQRFLADAKQEGDYVRARNLTARYDAIPFELQLGDRSRPPARPSLPPVNKAA